MWLMSMLFRQPAVQGLRACSTVAAKQALSCQQLHLGQSLSRATTPASAAAAVTILDTKQHQQLSQDSVAKPLVSAAVLQPDLPVAGSDTTEAAAIQSKQCDRPAGNTQNAHATVMGTAAVDQSAQHAAVSQHQQQQQQQQPHSTADAVSFHTQLLCIDSAAMPVAAAPDAAAVKRILTAAAAPDLSRETCPHLYYEFSHQATWSSSSSSSSSTQHASLHSQSEHCQQQQQHYRSSSSSSDMDALLQAAALLQNGYPVAIPTETVYGLAGNALSASAVASIFGAKGRPADNPLIVHISDLDMLAQLYPKPQSLAGQETSAAQAVQNPNADPCRHIPQQYRRLIAAFWPGPLTILLPASPLIPAAVTAGHPTMAVRMPAHPIARALIAAAGVPLAAPSANSSGKPSPTTAQHVLEDLAGKVPAVVDGGGCCCGVESTVLDGLRVPPVILRPGGVSAEELEGTPDMAGLQVYSRDFTDKTLEATPTTPGMKYRHYSPSAPVLLLDPTAAFQQQQGSQQLQQAMADATQQLLQQVRQGQLTELLPRHDAAASDASAAQPQRVVLLRTCSSSSDAGDVDSTSSSSSTSCATTLRVSVGWTPDSLARIQQQQHVAPDEQPAAETLCSRSSSSGGGTGSSSGSGVVVEVLEYVLGSWQQPELVAQQLFSGLRAADHVGAQLVVVQGLEPVGPGLAVMNRLHKAASSKLPIGQCNRKPTGTMHEAARAEQQV